MSSTKTVDVPHLGAISASYRLSSPLDPSKPTLILINSFMTSADLFDPQFDSPGLTSDLNLLAIEPLGHGNTRTKKVEHFTYWDSAIMNLQVMDALGVKAAFVLGTSQGGWIAVRMALLAQERILGLIPLGTSMDAETPRSVAQGCWDANAACSPLIDVWSVPSADRDSFQLDDEFCSFLLNAGFGPHLNPDFHAAWVTRLKSTYAGDDGRRRARMCAINLRDRDGLYGRVADITCPVLWMHGSQDEVYSVANAQEEIGLITGVKEGDVRLVDVEGGYHFLSGSKPTEVEGELLRFVQRYSS